MKKEAVLLGTMMRMFPEIKWRQSTIGYFHYNTDEKSIYISDKFLTLHRIKEVKKALGRKYIFKNKYILYVLYIIFLMQSEIDKAYIETIRLNAKIHTDIVHAYQEMLVLDNINCFVTYSRDFELFYKTWKAFLKKH